MTSAPLDLDALEAKLAALNSMSFNENWIEKGRALGAELCHAAPALIAMARRVQQDAPREGTHAPDCHLWGPRHYDCLMREYDASRAEIARLRESLEGAETFIAEELDLRETAYEPGSTHTYVEDARDTLTKIRTALGTPR